MNNTSTSLARALVVAIVWTATVTVAHAGPMLDGAEIQKLYAENVMRSVTSRGGNYVGTYSANGAVSGVIDGKHRDEGKWWVENNTVCLQWSTWRKGASKCYRIEHMQELSYRVYTPEGSLVMMTVEHGH